MFDSHYTEINKDSARIYIVSRFIFPLMTDVSLLGKYNINTMQHFTMVTHNQSTEHMTLEQLFVQLVTKVVKQIIYLICICNQLSIMIITIQFEVCKGRLHEICCNEK